ncbi:MAG TPA: oxidoreductase [Blastocatellia bacterium]
MSDEIGVGLIGFGMAARVFHIPIIQSVPGLKLKRIVTRRRDEVHGQYPGIESDGDATSLVSDNEVQLVVVGTPTNTHFDLARQALAAGKHVVVEKPFTSSSAEADQLIRLASIHNRVLSVFQNRRWDGDFLTVQALLEKEILGRLVEYESHFDRFRNQPRHNWRETAIGGGGILFDLGSHLIDQALVLFGLPLTVRADVTRQRDFGESDDRFEVVLQYPRLIVTLKSGMLVREPCSRFILHGTEGSFVKYGYDPQEAALNRGITPADPDWGKESREYWGTLRTRIDKVNFGGRVETLAGCYQEFYENIVASLRGRAALAVDPRDARNTIRIIELAHQSEEERRTLPFNP